jgi:hypothetical protein
MGFSCTRALGHLRARCLLLLCRRVQLKSMTQGMELWRQAVEYHNEATMAPLPNVLPTARDVGPKPTGGA